MQCEVSETEQAEVVIDDFHRIIVGGDMLTAARARGCQRLRKCGQRALEQLDGVLPVCEDWLAKWVLLGVSTCHASYNKWALHVEVYHVCTVIMCLL